MLIGNTAEKSLHDTLTNAYHGGKDAYWKRILLYIFRDYERIRTDGWSVNGQIMEA